MAHGLNGVYSMQVDELGLQGKGIYLKYRLAI